MLVADDLDRGYTEELLPGDQQLTIRSRHTESLQKLGIRQTHPPGALIGEPTQVPTRQIHRRPVQLANRQPGWLLRRVATLPLCVQRSHMGGGERKTATSDAASDPPGDAMDIRPDRNPDDQNPRVLMRVLIDRNGERRNHVLEDVATGSEHIDRRTGEGLGPLPVILDPEHDGSTSTVRQAGRCSGESTEGLGGSAAIRLEVERFGLQVGGRYALVYTAQCADDFIRHGKG